MRVASLKTFTVAGLLCACSTSVLGSVEIQENRESAASGKAQGLTANVPVATIHFNRYKRPNIFELSELATRDDVPRATLFSVHSSDGSHVRFDLSETADIIVGTGETALPIATATRVSDDPRMRFEIPKGSETIEWYKDVSARSTNGPERDGAMQVLGLFYDAKKSNTGSSLVGSTFDATDTPQLLNLLNTHFGNK